MAKSQAQLELEYEELEARVQYLEETLAEIGKTASEALLAEHIQDWGDGGRLGDALKGIKDSVDSALNP